MTDSNTENTKFLSQDFKEFYDYVQNAHAVSRDILRINNELQDKIKYWEKRSKRLAKAYCIVTDYCWNPDTKRIEGFPNKYHLSYPINRKSSKFIIRLAKNPNAFYLTNTHSVEDIFMEFPEYHFDRRNKFIYLFEPAHSEKLIRLNDLRNDSFAKNVFQPAVLNLAKQMKQSVQQNNISFIDVFINNDFTLNEYLENSKDTLNDAITKMFEPPEQQAIFANTPYAIPSLGTFVTSTGSQLNQDNLQLLIKLMKNEDNQLSEKNTKLIAQFLNLTMLSKFSKASRNYSDKQIAWLRNRLKKKLL